MALRLGFGQISCICKDSVYPVGSRSVSAPLHQPHLPSGPGPGLSSSWCACRGCSAASRYPRGTYDGEISALHVTGDIQRHEGGKTGGKGEAKIFSMLGCPEANSWRNQLFSGPSQEPPFPLSISTASGSSSWQGRHPSLPWHRHIVPPASPPPPPGQQALLFPHPSWQFADFKLYPGGPIKYERSQIRIIAQKIILKKKRNKQTAIKAMELKQCLFPGSCWAVGACNISCKSDVIYCVICFFNKKVRI